MKKVLSLITTISMFICPVFAYNDIEEKTESITVLTDLDIMQGYDDNTFRPDESITRSEFAAVVVRALNLEGYAKNNAVDTVFSDVKKSDWFSGYVQVAQEKNIINGYPDGTFRPEEPVLYMEAVKMLVCLLGYAPKFENHPDAYPNGYIIEANQQGLTRGATGIITDPATRYQIAGLTYNALTLPMMEQRTYAEKVEYIVNEEKLILTTSLGVSKVEAEIKEIKDDSAILAINKETSLLYNEEDLEAGENTLAIKKVLDLSSYLNQKCFVLINMENKIIISIFPITK